MLEIKQIQEKDWEVTIPSWFKKYGSKWPCPPRDTLPNNGLGGAMVWYSDTPIACGFLYFTNSSCAILEFVIADIDYKENNRDEAISAVIEHLIGIAEKNGFYCIWAWIANESLVDKYVKAGFNDSGKGPKELIYIKK